MVIMSTLVYCQLATQLTDFYLSNINFENTKLKKKRREVKFRASQRKHRNSYNIILPYYILNATNIDNHYFNTMGFSVKLTACHNLDERK